MPRDNPRRITKQKLLRYTGQQSECKQIQAELDRHEAAVSAWRKRGFHYNPDTGILEPIIQ